MNNSEACKLLLRNGFVSARLTESTTRKMLRAGSGNFVHFQQEYKKRSKYVR